jgi:hypothetical protein
MVEPKGGTKKMSLEGACVSPEYLQEIVDVLKKAVNDAGTGANEGQILQSARHILGRKNLQPNGNFECLIGKIILADHVGDLMVHRQPSPRFVRPPGGW